MIGYNYSEAYGVRWRDNQGGLFPLSPPRSFSGLSQAQARKSIESSNALFVRWDSDFDFGAELPWWHIIKDSYDELSDLPKKTRYMIRKALNDYEAKKVSRLVIINQGYSVYESAYERYETHEPMLTAEKFGDALSKLPNNTEFWAVYERKSQRMVAFSENYVESDTCFYVTMWLEPQAMAQFSGYLLLHEMELHYLRDRGFKYVSDGARSLSHDTNIHDFLIRKFNFRKAYARLHVVYRPWLGLAVKLAYPFRHWIGAVPLVPFQKAGILLKQEAIRHECEASVS